MSSKKWIFADENIKEEAISSLMRELNCGYLLAIVLLTRGFDKKEDIKKLIHNEEEWNDPYLLPDMDKAISRIKEALEKKEKVAIFGDYDADGITASVILKKCFDRLGLENIVYLPDRINEGYGMNKGAVEYLHNEGVTLVVTVDCGVSCHDEIDYAKTLGIDTVVTDHHNCPEILPCCIGVVNPKRDDSRYPFKDLSGAGVAYKLATALIGEKETFDLLEFSAIGTIADIMDIKGENRKIVKEGIRIMNEKPSGGVKALLSAASKTVVDSTAVSFILSPRINCAGRMESPYTAFNLLLEPDFDKAAELAHKLNSLNSARQKNEQEIYDEAIEIIKNGNLSDYKVIVAGKDNWNTGVIGIVASKITEKVSKPCILIAYDDEGNGHASGRSIEGFNLYDALDESSDMLVKFGGHSMAAGLSLHKSKEDEFRKAINEYADKILKEEDFLKKVYIDASIPSFAVNNKNINELSLLEPFGAGNEKPSFAIVNAKIKSVKELSGGKHIKMLLEKDGVALDAVAFGFGHAINKLSVGMTIHVAGNLEINDFTGKPQIIIKEILC